MGRTSNGCRQFSDEDINRLRGALGRTVRELDRRTNQDDLTRTELTVLNTIARCRRVPLAELADLGGINPTMLSRIVGKLEDRGLVRRIPDAADRRVAHAEITHAGTKVWKHHRRVRTELLAQLLAELPPPESEALLAAIPALEALGEIARSAE